MQLTVVSVVLGLLLHHPKGVRNEPFPGRCPSLTQTIPVPYVRINYKIYSEVHLADQLPSYLFSQADKRESLYINSDIRQIKIIYKSQGAMCPTTFVNSKEGWLAVSKPDQNKNCRRVEEQVRVFFWDTANCSVGFIWTCKESSIHGEHEEGGLALLDCQLPFEINANNAKVFVIQKLREYFSPALTHQVESNWKSNEKVLSVEPYSANRSCPILQACKYRRTEVNIALGYIVFGLILLVIVIVFGNQFRMALQQRHNRVGPEVEQNIN